MAPPDEILPYKQFDPVSRRSFMSFIIGTFYLSPKDVPLQATYCFFVQFKTGFLVESSIRTLLDHPSHVSAFDYFSPLEQKHYFDAYNSLTRPNAITLPMTRHLAHKGWTRIHKELTRESHKNSFELAMQDLVQAMHVRNLAFPLYPEMPWAEFQQFRETYLYSEADASAQK